MKKIMLTLLVVFFAASAWATPIYQGDPVADFGTGDSGNPAFTSSDFKGAGYYIWANDDARTSWSVRWTGRESTTTDDYGWYDWSGKILYSVNGIDSMELVLWEPNDGIVQYTDSQIVYGSNTFDSSKETAKAGPGWDGFDFTLIGDVGDYLTFALESTLFDNSNLSSGVYIGQEHQFVLDNVDSTQFWAGTTGEIRQFEVAAPVPEPGTLFLLGAGVAGLALYRRKSSKK